MTQSDLPDTDLDAVEPIDADFEPAPSPEDDKTKARKSGGPGWLGASVLALMAAGAGGAIGLVADKPPFVATQNSADTSALQKQIAELVETQSRLETQLTERTTELETRLRTDLSALVSSDGTGENLSALIAELDAVSKRLDDAMAAQPGSATLSQLTDRLSALESIDTSGDVSATDMARAVAGLGERLTTLETALAEMPAQSTGPTPESITAIETEITALKSTLETIANANSEDATKVASLIEDMRAKEETALQSAAAAKASTEAVLALAAIETASARGEAFAAPYRDLRKAMPDSAPVRALAGISEKSVPTLNALASDFAGLRTAAIKVAPKPTEPGALGWLNRTFGDAVTVEPADGKASTTEAQLDEASGALKAGDLASAVESLSALDPAPQDVFADWTRSANARIKLDTTLATLRQAMIEGGE